MASIFFVLDRSGSMYNCLTDTIGGFNCFIDSQKNDNENGSMSLYFFNNSYSIIYENKPMKEVENLTPHTYHPNGHTALLDAIGTTVLKVSSQKFETPPTIVILTDGFENASTIYTKSHISDLIKLYTEKDNWNFVFLAANQDAIQVGGSLGIPEESAMTFDPKTVEKAFEGLGAAMGRQISGQDTRVQFTELERAASQSAPGSPVSTNEVFTGVPSTSLDPVNTGGGLPPLGHFYI